MKLKYFCSVNAALIITVSGNNRNRK